MWIYNGRLYYISEIYEFDLISKQWSTETETQRKRFSVSIMKQNGKMANLKNLIGNKTRKRE